MELLDLLEALIKLGLPLAAISWFLFSWLYSSGQLDREHDHKEVSAQIKNMKKSFKRREAQNSHYIYDKWMWFGSGFYGLAALWTFFVIEIMELLGFIFNFPGFAQLFADGVVSLLLTLALNQLGNFINAFVWFSYWSGDSIVVLILMAYLGYWSGVELARRGYQMPVEEWFEKYWNNRQ